MLIIRVEYNQFRTRFSRPDGCDASSICHSQIEWIPGTYVLMVGEGGWGNGADEVGLVNKQEIAYVLGLIRRSLE